MSTKKNVENLLSRRETLAILGAAGATAIVGCGSDSASALLTGTPTRTALATSTPPAATTSTPTSGATATIPGGSATPTSAGSTPTATSASATATAEPSATPEASGTGTETPISGTETPTFTSTPTPEQLSCVVKPSLTEGPFFVDEMLNRSDLTTDTDEPFVLDALPLRLRVGVYRVSGGSCIPLEGAQIDIWHTSAEGVYSDEASGQSQSKNTLGETYLRGYQLADANGLVNFVTIYPGWYVGRTAHIHFKVRTYSPVSVLSYEFTSQIFFEDAVSDQVYAVAPYNTRGTRTVRNSNDGIYDSDLVVAVVGNGHGYDATFTIGLNV